MGIPTAHAAKQNLAHQHQCHIGTPRDDITHQITELQPWGVRSYICPPATAPKADESAA